MPAARLPALLALLVMLVAAPIPWRVSAHADEHHGHVWLPDAHAWDHLREHHRHGCDGDPLHDDHHEHDGCTHRHAPDCPECPDERGCHCTDEPLATGLVFDVVTPPPHLLVRSVCIRMPSLVSVGAPEVAPSDPGGCRRACEEDPIVLLR